MAKWQIALTILGAYLVGTIPTGYILVRALLGEDIRQFGSGNIGATNVTRRMGRRWGFLVLLLDVGKGFLACLVAAILQQEGWGPANGDPVSVLCGLAAIIGNMFPIYLGFRGGKGVSTSCGVFLCLFPTGSLAAIVTWGIAALIWRYVSLASILALISLVAASFLLPGTDPLGTTRHLTIFCILAAALVVIRHHSNIRRLLNGTEKKIREGTRGPSPNGSAALDIDEYLRDNDIEFQRTQHPTAITAQEVAQIEHVSGNRLAKTVIVKAGGEFIMLVLPATRRVALERASQCLGASATMATEDEIEPLFPDVEVGAEPPFGSQYGLKTLADGALTEQITILFRAGNHRETVEIAWDDYVQLENPQLADFSDHI